MSVDQDGTRTPSAADSAVQRASELGAEHGTRAAEDWWPTATPSQRDFLTLRARKGMSFPTGAWLPQPDLRNNYDNLTELFGADVPRWEMTLAWEAAFTAAVEATIRAKCEEV